MASYAIPTIAWIQLVTYTSSLRAAHGFVEMGAVRDGSNTVTWILSIRALPDIQITTTSNHIYLYITFSGSVLKWILAQEGGRDRVDPIKDGISVSEETCFFFASRSLHAQMGPKRAPERAPVREPVIRWLTIERYCVNRSGGQYKRREILNE